MNRRTFANVGLPIMMAGLLPFSLPIGGVVSEVADVVHETTDAVDATVDAVDETANDLLGGAADDAGTTSAGDPTHAAPAQTTPAAAPLPAWAWTATILALGAGLVVGAIALVASGARSEPMAWFWRAFLSLAIVADALVLGFVGWQTIDMPAAFAPRWLALSGAAWATIVIAGALVQRIGLAVRDERASPQRDERAVPVQDRDSNPKPETKSVSTT